MDWTTVTMAHLKRPVDLPQAAGASDGGGRSQPQPDGSNQLPGLRLQKRPYPRHDKVTEAIINIIANKHPGRTFAPNISIFGCFITYFHYPPR